MTGENNLKALLKNMSPAMQDDAFVFLTSKEGFSEEIQREAVMVFKEVEGMTVIVRKEFARTLSAQNEHQWAMITLTVHLDLNAVGFLAAITEKLAEVGISVNAVSAFYHDHLFVPWEKRMEAMEILHSLSE